MIGPDILQSVIDAMGVQEILEKESSLAAMIGVSCRAQ